MTDLGWWLFFWPMSGLWEATLTMSPRFSALGSLLSGSWVRRTHSDWVCSSLQNDMQGCQWCRGCCSPCSWLVRPFGQVDSALSLERSLSKLRLRLPRQGIPRHRWETVLVTRCVSWDRVRGTHSYRVCSSLQDDMGGISVPQSVGRLISTTHTKPTTKLNHDIRTRIRTDLTDCIFGISGISGKNWVRNFRFSGISGER